MDIKEFAQRVNPSETVLLLGAGASVPSGGDTGVGLARHLCSTMSDGEIESDNLSEAASLLEERFGRAALVAALSKRILPLLPDGGMLALVTLPWPRIYTTNYDNLIEAACRQRGRKAQLIKSNVDFPKTDSGELEILKIHGSIDRDRALGHGDSMILTEADYDQHSLRREALFSKLAYDMHTKDVLVIGHSLQDPHLRVLVDEIAGQAKRQGTPNRIKVLSFQADTGRIRLLAARSIEASSGSLSALVEHLTTGARPVAAPTLGPAGRTPNLPVILLNRTIDVSAAMGRQPNANLIFLGGSASYADIREGFTFKREAEDSAVEELRNGKLLYQVILGVSGVGKSTLARRILYRLNSEGFSTYEHVDEYPLEVQAWKTVALAAEASGKPVFLFVDEATKHLAGINRLLEMLSQDNLTEFRMVLCGHSLQWDGRSKSGLLKKYGKEERIERLSASEVRELVDLVRRKGEIRGLLDPIVSLMSRDEQIELIENKSSANMFVALKFCFANDSIDKIVLDEFNELPEDVQEVYKIAALLEATYANPSRQMILDLLALNWSDIPVILGRTKGVLQQHLIDRRDGLYVWRTRHPVIAQVIAKYKYADEDELVFVLGKIVRTLNAAMMLDRQTVPALCGGDFGIGRISDWRRQAEILEDLCKRSNSRVPWHRLIAIWLEHDLSVAETIIRRAESAVNEDSPISRYKVRLALAKAEKLSASGTMDYVALILDAESLARSAIDKWRDNKYSYLSLGEVGEALVRATGNDRILSDVVTMLDDAYDRILDDALLRWRQRFDNLRR